MPGSLSSRQKNAEAARKRRFDAKQADRRRANKAATSNVGKLGSGIASIPGRVVNYIKTSTPSSVARDVKNVATSTYNAAVEDPNAFAEDAIFSPLAAIRDFGDARAMAQKLRAQGRNAEAEKMEALAGTAVMAAVPILGRPAGVTLRNAVKAAEKTAIKDAVKTSVKAGERAATALPAQSPFSITGKADMGQEVLRLKAKEMEITDPKKRTQPTGTEPVFDLSQAAYEETPMLLRQTDPALVQAALPRAQAGATYPLNDRMRNVMDLTPRIAERLAEKAQQGRGTAQEYFYNTGPVVRGLEDIGVPRSEAIQFLSEKFAPAFAGTSPRTNTEQNMRNASLMMYLREKGVPITGELYDTFGNARGYNMMGSHQDLTGQMFAGTHDPMTNPKPSAFLPNVAGDLGYVTADTHNIRGALLAMNEVEPGSISPSFFKTQAARERYADTAEFDPALDINDSLQSAMSGGRKMQVEYGPMADVTFEAARQAGIDPGPMQSLGWFGSGADTGLASATKTVAELMDERINVTAQALGMHPKVVLRLYKEGKIPLMAKGGRVAINELAEKYAD